MSSYPVRLVGGENLQRARLTVLVRLVLLIPHVVLLTLYGIAAGFTAIGAWFAALVTGRVPAGMHEFIAGYVRYGAIVIAYLAILSDRFPPMGTDDRYEIDLEIDGPVPQNRLTVLFRAVLVAPCMLLLAYVFDPLILLVAVLNWLIALVIGRVPAGLQSAGMWLLRFRARTYAYFLLVNPRYPSFGAGSDGSLPADQAALPPMP